jgi:hypothetical protein
MPRLFLLLAGTLSPAALLLLTGFRLPLPLLLPGVLLLARLRIALLIHETGSSNAQPSYQREAMAAVARNSEQ